MVFWGAVLRGSLSLATLFVWGSWVPTGMVASIGKLVVDQIWPTAQTIRPEFGLCCLKNPTVIFLKILLLSPSAPQQLGMGGGWVLSMGKMQMHNQCYFLEVYAGLNGHFLCSAGILVKVRHTTTNTAMLIFLSGFCSLQNSPFSTTYAKLGPQNGPKSGPPGAMSSDSQSL